MSDKLPKENNELALVLNRINTLMKHNEIQAESAIQTKNIPQLTEIYEGEPLVFIPHPVGEFPTLNDVVTVAEKTQDQTGKLEALLAEMAPLIQTAINKATQQKLIDVELQEKIEAEVLQVLRERLQSLVVSGKP